MTVNRHPIKTLFLTYPQCEVTKERALEYLQTVDDIKEYVIARESHQDGNHHLHVYVKFATGLRTTEFTPRLDIDGHHGNYQPARSFRAVIAYCQKDGNYITNLSDVMLETPQAKRRKQVETITTLPIKQLIAEGHIPYQQARNALFVQSLLIEPYEHDTVRGIWIYGPPGVGKSHMARHNYPQPIYTKAQNKWWDGYAGQPTVLLDDFDCKTHLGHYLKIWADKWSCQGEIKGGEVQLVHRHFIVTSNYTISEMFPGDEPMIEAITRRFQVINLFTRP